MNRWCDVQEKRYFRICAVHGYHTIPVDMYKYANQLKLDEINKTELEQQCGWNTGPQYFIAYTRLHTLTHSQMSRVLVIVIGTAKFSMYSMCVCVQCLHEPPTHYRVSGFSPILHYVFSVFIVLVYLNILLVCVCAYGTLQYSTFANERRKPKWAFP